MCKDKCIYIQICVCINTSREFFWPVFVRWTTISVAYIYIHGQCTQSTLISYSEVPQPLRAITRAEKKGHLYNKSRAGERLLGSSLAEGETRPCSLKENEQTSSIEEKKIKTSSVIYSFSIFKNFFRHKKKLTHAKLRTIRRSPPFVIIPFPRCPDTVFFCVLRDSSAFLSMRRIHPSPFRALATFSRLLPRAARL